MGVDSEIMANRNASATLFGWDFQVNAAIVLMLENIKSVNKMVKLVYEDSSRWIRFHVR